METVTVQLSNGQAIDLGPVSAHGALRLEDNFGAGALTDSGSSDMRKSLGFCWISHLATLEDPAEEMTFEDFCSGIPYADIAVVVEAVAPFLKTPSAPTKSPSSSAEE